MKKVILICLCCTIVCKANAQSSSYLDSLVTFWCQEAVSYNDTLIKATKVANEVRGHFSSSVTEQEIFITLVITDDGLIKSVDVKNDPAASGWTDRVIDYYHYSRIDDSNFALEMHSELELRMHDVGIDGRYILMVSSNPGTPSDIKSHTIQVPARYAYARVK